MRFIGKKIGMTQLFLEDGTVEPATVLQAGPCVVVQAKTAGTDGYEAVQLGFEQVRPNKLTSPQRGHLKDGIPPVRVLREVPVTDLEEVTLGDRIDAGDRELVAVTPPTFDSPTTRGLFDTTSGVYWASDAMGSPVPHEVSDISELDPGFWREGFLGQQLMLSPWLNWTSPERYDAVVERVRSLGASVVTSAHGPALRGSQIESACRLLRELPYLPPARLPGQMELDAIVAMLVPAADVAPVVAEVASAGVAEEVAA